MIQFVGGLMKNSWKPLGVGIVVLALALSACAAFVLVRGITRPADDAAAPAALEPTDQPPGGPVRVASGPLRAAGIEVESVRAMPMDDSINCQGNVTFNANKYVEVPSKAEGILRKINVNAGARVHTGQAMAVVDSDAIGELKASFIKGLVHEEHLRWQVDSLKAAGSGVPAKQLFESQHLLKEQLTDTARIRYRMRYFGLSDADIDEISRSEDPSVELNVRAPIDGTVVKRTAVEGEPVLATKSLFAIADLDTMWANLYVYEHDLGRLRLGQSVTFFPDGLAGRGFAGTVTWISPELNPQTRTLQVRAEMPNPDGALRANMFGRAKIELSEPRSALVVPQTAVQSHDGRHVVFVQTSADTFEPRPVEIGRKHAQTWEVITGLSAGEKVATTGSFLLKSNLENPEFGGVE